MSFSRPKSERWVVIRVPPTQPTQSTALATAEGVGERDSGDLGK